VAGSMLGTASLCGNRLRSAVHAGIPGPAGWTGQLTGDDVEQFNHCRKRQWLAAVSKLLLNSVLRAHAAQ